MTAWLVDACAAALFAAAAAFAGMSFGDPQSAAVAGCGGFAAALLFLRSVKPDAPQHRLPVFEVPDWDEENRSEPSGTLDSQEPLLLDDVLEMPASSRVVQLFASPPLPSPGELKARIDAHLACKEPAGEIVRLPVDASAALREALADLRRSLG